MKRLIIAALLVLASCAKDDSVSNSVGSTAKFSAESIMSRVESSTDSSEWEGGDAIGISSNNDDTNVKYTADQSGAYTTFTFADTAGEIILPRTTAATYSAYYPYQNSTFYTSDVSTQSDWGAIDFLVAAGVEGKEDSGDIVLEFEHMLSIIKLNISFGDELVDSYSGDLGDYVEFTLVNAMNKAKYKFDGTFVESLDNGNISLVVDSSDDTAMAIINPTGLSQSLTLSASFDTIDYEDSTITYAFTAGEITEFDVTLGFNAITITKSPNIIDWNEGVIGDIDFDNMTKLTSGTASNPFIIYDADDLQRVGTNGTSEATGSDLWSNTAHYKVADDTDINCGGATISIALIDDTFYGDFDGNNRTISNFTISATDAINTGLFSKVGTGGKVYDLAISGATITSASGYVGAITGYNAGTISGCTVSGSVTNTSDVYNASGTGGIAGRSTCLIERCVNDAEITGCWKVGGIVGYLDEQTVVNCGNTGAVKNTTSQNAEYSYQQGTGGVVGYSDSKSAVTRCYNWGDISSDCYQTGGIVGYTNGTLTSGCYNIGNVSDYDYAGGVVGRVYDVDNVTDCYYLKGSVSSNTSSDDRGIGHVDVDSDHILAMDDSDMQTDTFLKTLNAVVSPESANLNTYTIYDWQLIATYPTSK